MTRTLAEAPSKVGECVACMVKKEIEGYLPGKIQDKIIETTSGKAIQQLLDKILKPIGVAKNIHECTPE